MKRFFRPIEKEGSIKKPKPPSPSSSASPSEHGKPTASEGAAEEEAAGRRDPTRFVTWNANSLLLRAKNDWKEFSMFVQTTDPDVICVQEVRMPSAGCKGAPKNPSELKDTTSSSRDDKQVLMRAISSPSFGDYRVWWSLSDSKYAAGKHELDGRVILAEFETFRLLNTYSPNNGWKEDENSFKRRRKWDKRILEFVQKSSDKPLIWCGDLNVSHQDIDVSHPEFFSNAKLNGYVPPNKEDCGQPGFTLAERQRFATILSQGRLIDAYRHMHKEQDMESGFSWSGHPVGKYRGKRMRIDYFIVSEQLKERIIDCKMHGQGIELVGFYGSDHCPVSLELSPTT